ncbi:MAG: hypothetical protein HUU14_02170 [Dehalococcoidia bacterium]|nr:MAG: hypothetical protein EDM76_13450 [bacterium]MCK6564639.1 hypothetical protein [Dehalococcoidia bacterium]MCL4231217.1 hypothetical protein [Dehalococcoidia bacterium]NUQ54675.1 hypothetical protein [Dehalococcoidia bacterium]
MAAFLALALIACGEGGRKGGENGNEGPGLLGPTVVRPGPAGEPRGIRIGFSALPPERTTEAYIGAFATAAQYADLILIQRAPPWEDFMAGGQISQGTEDTTLTELKLLKQYSGLELFYAIDPTDGVVQRSRIANLPAGVDPQVGFEDQSLRNAFVAYAAYVAKNYSPDYLALGVEINMLYARAPKQFEAFVSLYREAYTVAKAASPKTKVFPTFQLEDLEGKFGDVHPPQWEVLDPFRGHMDALAISTYPYLGDHRSAAEIRPDYYSQLKARWDGEILISEAGYASQPVEGEANVGTEEDQLAFLQRLLGDAEANGFSAVVWLAALDPAFAAEGAAAVFKDVGLRKSDGSNKLAWGTWEEWARRPLK